MTCVDNKMWSNGVMLWRHIFITRGDRRICSLQTSRFPRVRAVIIFVDISIQPQDLTPLSRVRAWLLSLCGCWPASCSCSAQWWPTPASSARTSSPSSRSGKTPGLGLELSRCYPNFSYLVTISYNPSSVLLSCLCVSCLTFLRCWMKLTRYRIWLGTGDTFIHTDKHLVIHFGFHGGKTRIFFKQNLHPITVTRFVSVAGNLGKTSRASEDSGQCHCHPGHQLSLAQIEIGSLNVFFALPT